MHKPLILVIPGSTRQGSVHRKLASEAVAAVRSAGAETVLADLRDYPLPLYDGDLESASGIPALARQLKELARKADGFVIASPEYNGSYPGVLKNAIDWISRPEAGEGPLEVFRGKVAAIVSATPGAHGSSRLLKQLRELLGMIRVEVVEQLGISDSTGAFDSEGRLAREQDATGLRGLASAVVRAANAQIATTA